MPEQDKFNFDMVSRASHRIGALLTVIKEGISIVSEETVGKVNANQKKSLLFSQRAVNRLTQVVTDLIDLEKILVKEIKSRKEKTEPYELVNSLCESMREEAALKDIALINQLTANPGTVYIDRDKISRAMVNLIEDIIKYTPPGGHIYISSAGNDKVEISIKSDNVIKGMFGYTNFPSLEAELKDLLKNNKISLNIIIAKALIETEGGRVKLLKSKDNVNEIIFDIPRYKTDNG
jgi:signal transduction histidine kinase